MLSWIHPWCGTLWGTEQLVDPVPLEISLHKAKKKKEQLKDKFSAKAIYYYIPYTHTNKLSEGEFHFGLVRRAATHELCFHFQVFQVQIENFLLQGLLEPRTPLLIWAQVRDGEADCKAQHWGTDCQRYMTVGGSMAVIEENLCKGLVLWNEFRVLDFTIHDHVWQFPRLQ